MRSEAAKRAASLNLLPIIHYKKVGHLNTANTAGRHNAFGTPRASLYAPRSSVLSEDALQTQRQRVLQLRKDIVAFEAREEQQYRLNLGQPSLLDQMSASPSPRRLRRTSTNNEAIMKYWMGSEEPETGTVVIHV